MPIAEITVLIQVGGLLGGWNTVGLILLTAATGAFLVRREGLHTLQVAQQKMQQGEVPDRELVEGLMLIVAGVLMVTPGLITDAIGFALVIPASRKLLAAKLQSRIKVQGVGNGGFGFGTQGSPFQQSPFEQASPKSQGDVFEGEYKDNTPNNPTNRLD